MASPQTTKPPRLEKAISGFIGDIESQSLGAHSFILVWGGQRVAECYWRPFSAARPHLLYSLSKSFTSTAIGFAASERLVGLDESVAAYFPERMPAWPDSRLARMKVRHLLTMSTGHEQEDWGARQNEDWAARFLAQPVAFEPGTRFLYESLATYMLSAILQARTGQTLLEYLGPRLFEPLGIEAPTWQSCPRGINVGGWGLSVTTEAIARFGQLYLQDGVWQGKRLLPEGWVSEATRKHISNGDQPNSDWGQGYGYQFWRCRHGAYRGDGAFGQFCVVLPDQQAVIAMTSSTDDMQGVLNAVWEHLLPALEGDPQTGKPIALDRQLARPDSSIESPLEASIGAGPFVGRKASGISSVGFEFGDQHVLVRLGGDEPSVWLAGRNRWSEPGESPMCAAAAWTSENVLELKLVDLDSTFTAKWRAEFAGRQVRLFRSVTGVMGATPLESFEGEQTVSRESPI